MGNFNSTAAIRVAIQKGTFNPKQYLSNMSLAYYQDASLYVAKELFPTVPVLLSTGYYHEFSAEDLARDNVSRKPEFGKVTPAIVGHSENMYSCKTDQVIRGIDQLAQLNYTRTAGVPASVDPRRSIARFMAEQMNIHQDILFAHNFFKSGVWENEWTGGTTDDAASKAFIKFNDANSDPLNLFDALITEISRIGRRRPNKLGLGIEAWNGLKQCVAILDRIKGGASVGNPAIITPELVAQFLGLKKVVVFASTYNSAGFGQDAKMNFICDPKSALLCYAPDAPAIDEPSAGYSFTWDMLGDGNYFPTLQWPGENGTHSEFMEGLMALDQKKTSDSLAVFLKDCV